MGYLVLVRSERTFNYSRTSIYLPLKIRAAKTYNNQHELSSIKRFDLKITHYFLHKLK